MYIYTLFICICVYMCLKSQNMVLAMAEVDHTNSSSVESSLWQLHMFSFGGAQADKIVISDREQESTKKNVCSALNCQPV